MSNMSNPRSQTNRIRGAASSASHSSRDFVEHYPASTTLAAFGLGLSVGVALVYMLSDDSSRHDDSNVAQRLGRQVLEAMSHALPESLSKFRR